jgi:GTP-binding protein
LYTPEICQQVQRQIATSLSWTGPIYTVSAVASLGTERLCQDIMAWLDERKLAELENPEQAAAERSRRNSMDQEVRARIQELRERHLMARQLAKKINEINDDEDSLDGDNVQVITAP